MKRFTLFFASFLVCLLQIGLVSAQQGTLTSIDKPGKLYSTIGLDSYKNTISNQLGSSQVDRVIQYAHEKSWPYGMSDYSRRTSETGQTVLKTYKVRLVAELSNDLRLLAVYREDNTMLSDQYLPKAGQPFYIVIDKIGLSNPSLRAPVLNTPASKAQKRVLEQLR